MKSRSFFLAIPILLAAFASTARAQQAVTFPSGDSTAQGVLYLPQGAGISAKITSRSLVFAFGAVRRGPL